MRYVPFLAVLFIAGCGGNAPVAVSTPSAAVTVTATVTPSPDIDACRDAMAVGVGTGWSDGRHFPPGAYAPVCEGVDRTTLERLMDEIVAEIMHP